MKIRELTEATSKYSFDQRRKAIKELDKLWNPKKNWSTYTEDEVKRAIELVKITGKTARVRDGYYTAGNLLDVMIRKWQEIQREKGVRFPFNPKVSTLRDMADQIAAHTNGQPTKRYPKTWNVGPGMYTYKDPSQFVEYEDEDSYDDAMEWVQKISKPVYYRDRAYKQLQTAYRIGKFLISDGTVIRGVFTDSPTHHYALAIQAASTLRNPYYEVQNITDQQAATIKDIAATKSATALEKIKLLIQVVNNKETDSPTRSDLEQVEASVKQASTLNSRDKAKIQSIIDGAKNFKEPNKD